MNINTKWGYAKQHVDSIAGHDDAPEEEVAEALASIRDYADGKLARLAADREARKPEAPAASES